jgi:serine/threonine protein kinase
MLAGRYRILELLGKGGMAKVYVAEQVAMQRKVAVKVIFPSAHEDPQSFLDTVARFRREAMACSRLEHPNTVRVFDYGSTDEGILFLVMELLKGKTLSEVLRLEGRLHPLRVVKIGIQVCKSLAEAHEKGVIHRDLKPQNIFLAQVAGEKEEVAKVLDFGVAKILSPEADPDKVTKSVVMGTPAYLSPERLDGRPPSPATDLYSLGITLYECLSGMRPFVGDTNEVMRKHREEPVPPLNVPDCPKALENLVYQLMEKEPTKRPASALEVAKRLEDIYESMVASRVEKKGTTAPQPKGSVSVRPEDLQPTLLLGAEEVLEQGEEGKRPRKRLVISSLALVLVVLVAGGLAIKHYIQQEEEVGTSVFKESIKAQPETEKPFELRAPKPAMPVVEKTVEPPLVEKPTTPPKPAQEQKTEVPNVQKTSSPSVEAKVAKPEQGGKSEKARGARTLPACSSLKCPFTRDCLDEEGRRVKGTDYCFPKF